MSDDLSRMRPSDPCYLARRGYQHSAVDARTLTWSQALELAQGVLDDTGSEDLDAYRSVDLSDLTTEQVREILGHDSQCCWFGDHRDTMDWLERAALPLRHDSLVREVARMLSDEVRFCTPPSACYNSYLAVDPNGDCVQFHVGTDDQARRVVRVLGWYWSDVHAYAEWPDGELANYRVDAQTDYLLRRYE